MNLVFEANLENQVAPVKGGGVLPVPGNW